MKEEKKIIKKDKSDLTKEKKENKEQKEKKRQNSNPYDNLYWIWYILREHATRDNPLSASGVHEIMVKMREDAPTQKTIATLLKERHEMLDYIFASRMVLPSESTVQKFLREQSEASVNVENAVKISCLAKSNHKFVNYDDYCEKKASSKNTKERSNQSNSTRYYYLEAPLKEGEWKILTDLIRFAPWISKGQTAHFLKVIHQLGGMPYSDDEALYSFKRENQNQFEMIRILQRGITEKKKVSISYGTHVLVRTQGKLTPHLVQNSKKPQKVIVPLSLVWSKGNYYLVARYQEDGTMHLRVDRMLKVMLTKESFTTTKEFSVVEHRDRSPLMYGGEQELVRFICPPTLLNTVMDVLGNTPTYDLVGEDIKVSVRTSRAGILLFALQHIREIEIIDPPELREEIGEILRKSAEKYAK